MAESTVANLAVADFDVETERNRLMDLADLANEEYLRTLQRAERIIMLDAAQQLRRFNERHPKRRWWVDAL